MYKELSPILSCNIKLKVLDIGSGDGTFINFLQSKFPQHIYYGCDISKEAIKINEKEKTSIHWKKVDFNKPVPYDRNLFDVIIAGEIIEHLYNTDNFFKEVHSILREDGILLLTTPNLASWMNRLFLLFGFQPFDTEVSDESHIFGKEFIYNLMGRKVSQSLGHLRCFTKKALRSLLKYYDFKVLKEVSCHVQPWHFNKLITKFLPNLSETQMIIVTK
ncbi:MAG: class I SAM-dependent methyltransferase [Actinobacteria bacterium]|nr:class I SAM-dependent methyltransferase [Actinomycetota bacterium]